MDKAAKPLDAKKERRTSKNGNKNRWEMKKYRWEKSNTCRRKKTMKRVSRDLAASVILQFVDRHDVFIFRCVSRLCRGRRWYGAFLSLPDTEPMYTWHLMGFPRLIDHARARRSRSVPRLLWIRETLSPSMETESYFGLSPHEMDCEAGLVAAGHYATPEGKLYIISKMQTRWPIYAWLFDAVMASNDLGMLHAICQCRTAVCSEVVLHWRRAFEEKNLVGDDLVNLVQRSCNMGDAMSLKVVSALCDNGGLSAGVPCDISACCLCAVRSCCPNTLRFMLLDMCPTDRYPYVRAKFVHDLVKDNCWAVKLAFINAESVSDLNKLFRILFPLFGDRDPFDAAFFNSAMDLVVINQNVHGLQWLVYFALERRRWLPQSVTLSTCFVNCGNRAPVARQMIKYVENNGFTIKWSSWYRFKIMSPSVLLFLDSPGRCPFVSITSAQWSEIFSNLSVSVFEEVHFWGMIRWIFARYPFTSLPQLYENNDFYVRLRLLANRMITLDHAECESESNPFRKACIYDGITMWNSVKHQVLKLLDLYERKKQTKG